MPDIFHDVPVSADSAAVFDCVSTADGLSKWWSMAGTGDQRVGGIYDLDFGPGYEWKAEVLEYEPNVRFAIRMTAADDDWTGTTIRFSIEEGDGGSMLRFEHLGWPQDNDHYRTSSYCWAMYLRCLKQYLEKGIVLPYEKRFLGE